MYDLRVHLSDVILVNSIDELAGLASSPAKPSVTVENLRFDTSIFLFFKVKRQTEAHFDQEHELQLLRPKDVFDRYSRQEPRK